MGRPTTKQLANRERIKEIALAREDEPLQDKLTNDEGNQYNFMGLLFETMRQERPDYYYWDRRTLFTKSSPYRAPEVLVQEAVSNLAHWAGIDGQVMAKMDLFNRECQRSWQETWERFETLTEEQQ